MNYFTTYVHFGCWVAESHQDILAAQTRISELHEHTLVIIKKKETLTIVTLVPKLDT